MTAGAAERTEATARDDRPTPGEIGLDGFAPYLMKRAMGRWNAEIAAALRARDLTTAQMRALAVLTVRPRPTSHELSVSTVTEPSTMSRTLDALEARGLVRRGARRGDARAREIAPTDAGTEAFARFWPAMRASHDAMFAGIGAEEREAVIATLRRIVGDIRRNPL